VIQQPAERGVQHADVRRDEQSKAAQAEQQRQEAQAEQERRAKSTAEADTRRKAAEAEQRRQAEVEQRKATTLAEAEAKQKADQAQSQRSSASENNKQLPQSSEINGAWLGVKIQEVTEEIGDALNIKPARGALIAGVDATGPAAGAHLEAGDVIVKLDGQDIATFRDVPRIVGKTPAGKTVEVIIVRKGIEEQRSVQLGALPTNPVTSSASDHVKQNQNVVPINYPSKPITMTVPFSPGGPSDSLGRTLAQRMSEIIGHGVSVENVAGEGGADGAKLVAEARPDGHRFLYGTLSTNALYQVVHATPRYDDAAFAPVILVAQTPLVLMARPNLQAGSLQEFLTYARANQNTLQYGSGGNGTLSHLACARFNDLIGVRSKHMPSPGIGPALQTLLNDRVDYFCETASTAKKMVGKVKLLATMAPERSKVLPNVATAREQGALNIDITYWTAIFLPKGTPSEIVQKLDDIVVLALNTPSVREKFETEGAALSPSDRRTSQYLGQFISGEVRTWSATVKATGLVLR